MGTRSLTYVFGLGEKHPIVCIYRQFDGFPLGYEECHGEDLLRILGGMREVNGLDPEALRETEPSLTEANGPDEAAALLVYHLKRRYPRGNIYLVPPIWPPPDYGQEYEYFVVVGAGHISVFWRERGQQELHRLFGPLPVEVMRQIIGP